MELGTILVVLGVLAAALAAVLNSPDATRSGPHWLLPLAVILVGVGVLLGTGEPWIKT